MTNTKLTPEIQKRYKENPNACPFCGSEYISVDYFDSVDNVAYRNVQCQNPECNMAWIEHFTLTHIDVAFNAMEED